MLAVLRVIRAQVRASEPGRDVLRLRDALFIALFSLANFLLREQSATEIKAKKSGNEF